MQPDHIQEQPDGRIDVGKTATEKLGGEARTHIQDARELESQADLSKLSTEDEMLYHYMQAIVSVLEQEYDILLQSK
jgi:hypothetical protein